MPARHAILLTEHGAKHAHPERASRAEGSLLAASLPIPVRFTQLLSRRQPASITPLPATLTKTAGCVPTIPILELISPITTIILVVSFQTLTKCKFRNSFVFTFMQIGGGVHPGGSILPTRHSQGRRGISPVRILPSLLPYIFASLLPSSITIAALPSGGEMSFRQRLDEIRTGFERPFWVANITEIFERLSYYGAFASLANYLHEKLNFPTERATNLTGLFGGLVWFLAIFGGAIADRLGFRRALSLAYLILAGSYFLLGSIGSSWLAPVRSFLPLVVLATILLVLPPLGVALVKPCVVGTTARASKENVRSIGYSIYYTLLNIGGSTGPWLAE